MTIRHTFHLNHTFPLRLNICVFWLQWIFNLFKHQFLINSNRRDYFSSNKHNSSCFTMICLVQFLLGKLQSLLKCFFYYFLSCTKDKWLRINCVDTISKKTTTTKKKKKQLGHGLRHAYLEFQEKRKESSWTDLQKVYISADPKCLVWLPIMLMP